MERMEDLNATGRMHKVTMTNRRTCTVNGVNDVLSFDLREILLETEQGMLMIRGNELRIPQHPEKNRNPSWAGCSADG